MKRYCSFLLLVSVMGFAETPPVLRISETAATLEWKVLEDDHGGFYVLWTDRLGANFVLLAQHVGVDGNPIWDKNGIPLGSVTDGPRQWHAFPDGKGGMGIVWLMGGIVKAQIWDDQAQSRWQSPLEISVSSSPIETPAAVADGSGGIFVVWAQRNFADRAVLLAQHVTQDGRVVWNSEGLRVSLRPSDQRDPKMIFDGSAGFHVAWTDRRDGSTFLRVQRMNFQGFRLWGMEGSLVSSPGPVGPVSRTLQMAPVAGGSLRLAWAGSFQGHSQVFEQMMAGVGGIIAPSRLTPPAPGEQWNPVLWGDGIGASWMGWEDARNLKSWQAYVRGPSGEVALAPTESDQGRLALAEDIGGGLWAAWIEKRTGKSGIFVQRLNVQGQPLLGVRGQSVVEPLVNPETPVLIPLLPDHAAIIWVDQPRKGEWTLGWALYPPK